MNQPVLRLSVGIDSTSLDLIHAVKELQSLLSQEGFPTPVDGRFGPDTENAVKAFQRQHGLADDGVVGPLTWAALKAAKAPPAAPLLSTTYSVTDPSLLAQLAAAMNYRSFINEGAARHHLDSTVIAGLGSRESQWGLALKPPEAGGTGDFVVRKSRTPFRPAALPPDGGGFGRGLMQIDYDAFEFARIGKWKDPRENILFACQVLADCREAIRQQAGLDGIKLLRGTLAAYNAGTKRVLEAVQQGADLDSVTTGRNYSADVLSRAGWFQLKGWS